MRWLALPEKFEPIPDIHHSLKKPLFAASVVLSYSPELSRASLDARIPIKGALKYSIDVVGQRTANFEFASITERDDVKGTERVTTPENFKVSSSPTRLMAHLQALPAFAASVSRDEDVYGAFIVVGRAIQALRIVRVEKVDTNTFVGKTMTVDEPLDEQMFNALPWGTRRGFEFDWSDEKRTLTAARFQVPFFGSIEIR